MYGRIRFTRDGAELIGTLYNQPAVVFRGTIFECVAERLHLTWEQESVDEVYAKEAALER